MTGEGRFDATSLAGKVVGSVIDRAHARAKPCLLIAGSITDDATGQERETIAAAVDLTAAFGPGRAQADTVACIQRAGRRLLSSSPAVR